MKLYVSAARRSRSSAGATCGSEEDAVGAESDDGTNTGADVEANANESAAPEDTAD